MHFPEGGSRLESSNISITSFIYQNIFSQWLVIVWIFLHGWFFYFFLDKWIKINWWLEIFWHKSEYQFQLPKASGYLFVNKFNKWHNWGILSASLKTFSWPFQKSSHLWNNYYTLIEERNMVNCCRNFDKYKYILHKYLCWWGHKVGIIM